MLHPRPRTVWSRWLEGFEAMRLEARFPKTAILEFYRSSENELEIRSWLA